MAEKQNDAQSDAVQIRNGPCDGLTVRKPPLEVRGRRYGLGVPASEELQTCKPATVYHVYLWLPYKENYEHVDTLPFRSEAELRKGLAAMCKEEMTGL